MVIRHLATAALFVSLLGASTVASAYHEEDERPIYQTGHTLNQGEVRIGLLSTDVGAHDRLTLGIDHLYYILPIFNAHAKVQFYRDGDWSLALKGSLYYFDVDFFWWAESPTTRGWYFTWPLELTGTIPLADDWSLHLLAGLTIGSGKLEQTGDDYGGTAASNNFQIGATTEWRITRVFALNLRLRFAPWVDVAAAGGANAQVDPATTIEVRAEGDVDTSDAQFAFSAMLAAHFSWSWFNMRIGAGYGNLNLPGVNFLVISRTPIFELDLFARF